MESSVDVISQLHAFALSAFDDALPGVSDALTIRSAANLIDRTASTGKLGGRALLSALHILRC